MDPRPSARDSIILFSLLQHSKEDTAHLTDFQIKTSRTLLKLCAGKVEEEQGRKGVWGIASIRLVFTPTEKKFLVGFHGGAFLLLNVEGKKKSFKVELKCWGSKMKDELKVNMKAAPTFFSTSRTTKIDIQIPQHCGREGKKRQGLHSLPILFFCPGWWPSHGRCDPPSSAGTAPWR